MRWIADCSCKPIDRLETKGLMDWRGTAIKCSRCGDEIRHGMAFINLGDEYAYCSTWCYVRHKLPESAYEGKEAYWIDRNCGEYENKFSMFYYKQKYEQSQ